MVLIGGCQLCRQSYTGLYKVVLGSKDSEWWHYNCYQAIGKHEVNHIDALGAIERAEAEKAGWIKPEPVKPSPEYLIRQEIISAVGHPSKVNRILDTLSKHKYKIVDVELYEIVDKRQSNTTAQIPYNNWLCEVQNGCLAILGSTSGSARKTSLDKNHIAVLIQLLKKTLDQWKNVEYNLY